MSLDREQEAFLEQASHAFDVALDNQEWDIAMKLIRELDDLGYGPEINSWRQEYVKAKNTARTKNHE